MMVFIWLDDERPMPATNSFLHDIMIHAHNYAEGIEALDFVRQMQYDVWVHFDHDLGETKTGYDVAKYIVENEINLKCFSVHSMNPVGAQNIYQLLTHYGYKYRRL